MAQAEFLKNNYINWLKEKLVFTDVENGYVSISTPFIDSNYDNIELFARFISKDKIEITDFGETLFNLEESGLKINKRSKTIYRLFEGILNDFGIMYNKENQSLSITTDVQRFPTAKNRLLQAVMRVNDLLYLNKENVSSTFNDIMTDFLINNKILFSPNIEIVGQNGISSHFDFSIPLPEGKERLIKTAARPNDINQAKIFNFDVRETANSRDAKYVLLLNDSNNPIGGNMNTNALVGLDKHLAEVKGFEEIQKKPNLLAS